MEVLEYNIYLHKCFLCESPDLRLYTRLMHYVVKLLMDVVRTDKWVYRKLPVGKLYTLWEVVIMYITLEGQF